jgi:hypothetical protein
MVATPARCRTTAPSSRSAKAAWLAPAADAARGLRLPGAFVPRLARRPGALCLNRQLKRRDGCRTRSCPDRASDRRGHPRPAGPSRCRARSRLNGSPGRDSTPAAARTLRRSVMATSLPAARRLRRGRSKTVVTAEPAQSSRQVGSRKRRRQIEGRRGRTSGSSLPRRRSGAHEKFRDALAFGDAAQAAPQIPRSSDAFNMSWRVRGDNGGDCQRLFGFAGAIACNPTREQECFSVDTATVRRRWRLQSPLTWP